MCFVCPNCGGDVPEKAKACRHCGSDENTGWSEMTYLDGIDLGEDSDHEEMIREGGALKKWRFQNRVFAGVVIFMVVLFLLRFVL